VRYRIYFITGSYLKQEVSGLEIRWDPLNLTPAVQDFPILLSNISFIFLFVNFFGTVG